MIDFDDYSDDDIEDTGSQAEEPEVQAESVNPMDLILQKLEKFERDLASRREDPVEPVEEMPVDETYGFDPAAIVSGAGKAAMKATLTLRKAEEELRQEFGDKLDPEDINGILVQLSSVDDVRQLDEMVNRRGAHKVMAKALYGDAVISGRVKPGAQSPAKPSPVGSEAPRDPGGHSSALAEFERLYGPVKSRRQRDRLNSIGGIS